MPRVNLDDPFFGDDRRFEKLARITNENHLTARMRVIFVWRLCYTRRCVLLNADEIQIQAEWDGASAFAEHMVSAGLAERTEDGFRIKGVEERIKYLLAQSEKAKEAARARGRKPKKQGSKPQASAGKASANAEHMPANPSEASAFSSSASSSVSASSSTSEFMNPSDSCAKAQQPEVMGSGEGPSGEDDSGSEHERSPVQMFIAAYCEAYKAKYEFSPLIADQAGSAKNIVKALGFAKATELIDPYLSMTDAWFLTKRHDLHTMKSNLNAIKQFHETGQTVTRLDKKHAETGDYLRNQLKRIAGGAV